MTIAALLAGLFSGILGSMGLGGGGILILYLALFTDTPQLTAQGINLLFFIPIGLLSVIIYSFKKQIKWKIVLKIAIFGLLGSLLGIYLAGLLGGKITSKIFGLLLIIMGIMEIFKKGKK
ncbi:MAG: sulfite exporter TauE/SafE family protein [Clostridia bacterium]|nr:sulfite exporter TauE/SafE family protein [Clostridia bacterium]